MKASPRQLEMLLEESQNSGAQGQNPGPPPAHQVLSCAFAGSHSSSQDEATHRAVEELIRVISHSNVAISVEDIDAIVGAGTGQDGEGEQEVEVVEKLEKEEEGDYPETPKSCQFSYNPAGLDPVSRETCFASRVRL